MAKIQDLYARLKLQHGLSGPLVANERLHLTLECLGDSRNFRRMSPPRRVPLRSFVGDSRYEEVGRWPLQA